LAELEVLKYLPSFSYWLHTRAIIIFFAPLLVVHFQLPVTPF